MSSSYLRTMTSFRYLLPTCDTCSLVGCDILICVRKLHQFNFPCESWIFFYIAAFRVMFLELTPKFLVELRPLTNLWYLCLSQKVIYGVKLILVSTTSCAMFFLTRAVLLANLLPLCDTFSKILTEMIYSFTGCVSCFFCILFLKREP